MANGDVPRGVAEPLVGPLLQDRAVVLLGHSDLETSDAGVAAAIQHPVHETRKAAGPRGGVAHQYFGVLELEALGVDPQATPSLGEHGRAHDGGRLADGGEDGVQQLVGKGTNLIDRITGRIHRRQRSTPVVVYPYRSCGDAYRSASSKYEPGKKRGLMNAKRTRVACLVVLQLVDPSYLKKQYLYGPQLFAVINYFTV